jgi:hypothetical protein
MAESRYSNSKVVREMKDFDPNTLINRLDTWPAIRSEELISNDDVLYELKSTDRADTLAHKFLGDGRYWWMICLLNDITFPFGKEMNPGNIIRIPADPGKILNIVKIKSGRKN